MPGIYGAAGAVPAGLRETADKMLGAVSACRDMRRFNCHSASAANFAGFSLNNRMFADLKTPYEDDDLLALFDGNVFNLGEIGLSGLTYAEAAAKSFREKGEKFAADFRGHFVVTLLEKRANVLRVYADAVAAKPVYYMHHGGVFYFATELKALLPVGPLPKRFDLASMGEILHSGYVITHRTLVEEAKEIKSAGLFVYDVMNDRLTKTTWHDHTYHPQPLSREEHMERMGQALTKACGRAPGHAVSRGRRILITVTGGMDSRCIAAAAHREYPGAIHALTHRFHDDFETDYAARVCKALDIRHIRAPLDDGLLGGLVDETVVAGEAMTHFADVWRFVAALKDFSPDDYGIIHTGVPGCALMGSFIHAPMLATPDVSIHDPAAIRGIARRLGHYTHPQSNEMFFRAVGDGGSHWDAVYRSVGEVADECWQGPNDWAAAQERVMLHFRQIRGASGAFRGIEERMDFSAPFWDLDLVRCAMEMPAEVKRRGALYYEFLRERLLPRALVRIPNTRNFGPLRRNVELSVFEWRWKRRFLRGVLGRISKRYRRLFGCSYLHAVRENPSLRNFMADLLADFDVPLACGVDGAKWRRVLGEWRADPARHLHLTRHFFWLMYLRRFLDLWGRYISTP